MEIGTLLFALTVGFAPLALGVAAGYAALTASLALFQTALDRAAPGQTEPLDNVMQMPIRGSLGEIDVDIRLAA